MERFVATDLLSFCLCDERVFTLAVSEEGRGGMQSIMIRLIESM